MNHKRALAIMGVALLLSACGHGMEPSTNKPSPSPSPSPSPPPPVTTVAPEFVYAGNATNNTIAEFETAGSTTKQIRTISAGVNQPIALVLDSQGNLYCGNQGGVITEYDPSGALIRTITGAAPPMAVDSKGNLYSEEGDNGVVMYAPGATTPSASVNANGSGEIAVDTADNVYVAAFGGNSVTEYSPGFASAVRTVPLGNFGQYPWRIVAIAVNKGTYNTGELAVATMVLDFDGKYTPAVLLFGPGQTTPYKTWLLGNAMPRNFYGLAYDNSGDLFVSAISLSTQAAEDFGDEGGVYVKAAPNGAWTDSFYLLTTPVTMAIDGKGDLVAADPYQGLILYFPLAPAQSQWQSLPISLPAGVAATQD